MTSDDVTSRNVRLIDVAQRAGVSIATASRSLSGSPGVSEQMAEHVRRVATELGYIVNAHARALAGGTAGNIGLLVHEVGDPYFAEIASGVLNAANERGLSVQICHTGRDPEVELAQFRILAANGIETIILAGSGFVDAAITAPLWADIKRYVANGGRVATIGRHRDDADAVLPDNTGGGAAIAAHVADLGHRSIGVIAGSAELTTVADRLEGLLDELQQRGIEIGHIPVIDCPFTITGGQEAARGLLRAHPELTAIMCLNDAMAMGALSELRSSDVDVPNDISVTGFDDVQVAALLAPSLSTVRLPMASFGRLAVELADDPSDRVRRRSTTSELIIRDSTARPSPRRRISKHGGARSSN